MRSALYDLAHARAGDKGDVSMISLIAYRHQDYPALCAQVTPARVAAHFADLPVSRVERFAAPSLGALNFVLHGALAGGVTRSLALDVHGKALASCLLEMEIDLTGPG